MKFSGESLLIDGRRNKHDLPSYVNLSGKSTDNGHNSGKLISTEGVKLSG
jgi:hypothetical protein